MEQIFEDIRNRKPKNWCVRVVRAPFRSSGLIPRLCIVAHALLFARQLIHVTGDIHYANLLIPKRRNILTIADCGSLNTSKGWKYWFYKKFWFEWPVAKAAAVTVISNEVKRDLAYHLGFDSPKVRVIPVAISDAFQPVPKRLNLQKPRILQLGTAPNKNVVKTIQALAGIHCELVVVGEPKENILVVANQCNVEIVNYVGLSFTEILEQYAKCDIVVFASTFEGFGMPILEAQATGRPVVTSNVSSMPEVAGDAACFVDPFDVQSIRAGIKRVIEDNAYRTHLIERGFENAKRFNAQRIADQYFELYRKVACGE